VRTDEFWSVVDRARSGEDPAAVVEAVVVQLAARPAPAIEGFDRHLRRVLDASYREDLWGAAYLINGGCSDEGFDAFRGWLMTQGRTIFARGVAEPDSLAELSGVRRAARTGEELGVARMLTVAQEAHRRLTGADLPADGNGATRPDVGDFWDFDDEDEARRRLPRLSALFLAPPQE
jgi:Protein of unknown function (DUF4240)